MESERLAIYAQNVNAISEIQWNDTLSYGDIYQRNEFDGADIISESASVPVVPPF